MTLAQQMDYIDTCVIRFQQGKLTTSEATHRINSMVSLVPKLKEHGKLAIKDVCFFDNHIIVGSIK